MSKMLVDVDFVDFIFESESNRKVFAKYLREYFHELGDKFWSRYYVHHYQSLIPYRNVIDTNTYTFAFYKINGSNYKSPIVHFNRVANRVQISPYFNKMQHYTCKDINLDDIKNMFKDFKRMNSIGILLNEN